FFFQAEDGIRDRTVTGVQTCALPIYVRSARHFARPPPLFLHNSAFSGARKRQIQNYRSCTSVCRTVRRCKCLTPCLFRAFALLQIGRASCRERVYVSLLII